MLRVIVAVVVGLAALGGLAVVWWALFRAVMPHPNPDERPPNSYEAGG